MLLGAASRLWSPRLGDESPQLRMLAPTWPSSLGSGALRTALLIAPIRPGLRALEHAMLRRTRTKPWTW